MDNVELSEEGQVDMFLFFFISVCLRPILRLPSIAALNKITLNCLFLSCERIFCS